MKKRYVILAGILAMTVAAAGCGKKEDPKDNTQTPQATVAPAADDGGGDLVNMQKSTGENTDIKNVIGTKTETASQLVLINNTGSEVASIYIRPNSDDDDEWGDELVQGKFTLKNGDKALYYYDKNLKDDEGNPVTNYDIRISFTDEDLSEFFFRKIPLTTVTEISLLVDGKDEDAIPYAEYATTTSKKKVSTLQEVKRRLGLTDESDTGDETDTGDGNNGDNNTAQPTQAPQVTQAPEPTQGPDEGDEPDDDPAKVAESFIGKSLDELTAACGEPTGHDYQNEPETGETGYHYYDTFTVSTTVDADGNEIVAGVW